MEDWRIYSQSPKFYSFTTCQGPKIYSCPARGRRYSPQKGRLCTNKEGRNRLTNRITISAICCTYLSQIHLRKFHSVLIFAYVRIFSTFLKKNIDFLRKYKTEPYSRFWSSKYSTLLEKFWRISLYLTEWRYCKANCMWRKISSNTVEGNVQKCCHIELSNRVINKIF